jgi:hypothetical protein
VFAKSESNLKPDWVDNGSSTKWHRAQYLIGVGSGDTSEIASANARKELAQSISSNVVSHLRNEKQSQIVSSLDGKTEGKDADRVNIGLEVKTNINLRGAEIVETYHDQSEKKYFALAVIDKLKAKNSYALEIKRLTSVAMGKFEQFKKDLRVSDGRELLGLLEKIESLQVEIMAFGSSSALISPISEKDREFVLDSIRSVEKKNSMLVELTSNQSGLFALLSDCLSRSGFLVTTAEGGVAKYRASYHLVENEVEINVTGWRKADFVLSGVITRDAEKLGTVSAARVTTCRSHGGCIQKVQSDLVEEACSRTVKLIEQR